MLFYREALRREGRQSAAFLLDVNAGMAGGEHARKRLAQLLASEG